LMCSSTWWVLGGIPLYGSMLLIFVAPFLSYERGKRKGRLKLFKDVAASGESSRYRQTLASIRDAVMLRLRGLIEEGSDMEDATTMLKQWISTF
jgi:hypothetical protein